MKFAAGLALLLALVAWSRAEAQAPVNLSLDYDGSLWIKVLDVHLDEKSRARDYDAAVWLRDYGLLRALHIFDIKADAHGPITADGAEPQRFFYDNHDGKRDRQVHVDWRADEVTMTSTPRFSGLGKPPASLEQKLASADPLTQLVRLTLAPVGVCQGEPHFFDGKQLYALSFGPGEPVAVMPDQRALGMTTAVHCTVAYREIAGFKQRPGENRDQALKSHIDIEFARFGQEGPWVIARISATTFMGPAVVELRHAHMDRDNPVAEQQP